MRPLIIFIFCYTSFATAAYSQSMALSNVYWFDGSRFVATPLYMADGYFSLMKPDQIDTTIDMGGGFMIPPLTETHTHNLCTTYQLEDMIDTYVAEGTFYIQTLGGSLKESMRADVILADSPLEVVRSNGGITCTLGHPFTVYEPLAMGIHDPREKRERGQEISGSRLAENDAYYFFDTRADVDVKWEGLMKTGPRVIKMMLYDAANYDSLYNDRTRMGNKGVSPDVAQYVVEKAHSEGLSVVAHIETAADFNLGVNIGLDIFAHLPGYGWRGDEETLSKYRLSDMDLKKAGEQGVTVMTTAGLSKNYIRRRDSQGKPYMDHEAGKRIVAYQKRLISRLRDHGITVAIGSDQYGQSLMTEVDYLDEHQMFTPVELLQIITRTNAALVFPGRKIGAIAEGFEASFIVLDRDPLKDINALNSINTRVKEGVFLK